VKHGLNWYDKNVNTCFDDRQCCDLIRKSRRRLVDFSLKPHNALTMLNGVYYWNIITTIIIIIMIMTMIIITNLFTVMITEHILSH